MSTKNMLRINAVIATLLVFGTFSALGSPLRSLTTAREIDSVLAGIPVHAPGSAQKNVLQRLREFGLQVTNASKTTVDSREEVESTSDMVGDVHYSIYLTAPSPEFKRTQCDMLGTIDVLLRKGKYYPESRTANWIMRGDCSTRFPIPNS